ncbi:MAG: translation initiation factor [Planctomycetaceae bacterium]|nr:translation initiation factor [Planctomycetaceae bacterium]
MAKKSNKILSGNGWSFEPAGRAEAAETPSVPDAEQKATVKLEKRAKGKAVTVVTGFVLTAADRKALAQTLRKRCGSGGADSPAGIEVQGDHRDAVRAFLAAKGWKVK